MAIDKNYAVLEIQKIFLDATNGLAGKASNFASNEDLYLHVAKEVYPHLEQVFRLVFEPTFNKEFNPPVLSDEELEIVKKLKEAGYTPKETQDCANRNLKLREENKELREANQQLGDYVEKLNIEMEGLRQNFSRVSNNVGNGDKVIELLKDIIIKGLRNE